MADYTYPTQTTALTNAKLLAEQIAALTLPGWQGWTAHASRDLAGVLHIVMPDLSPANKAALDAVIANHDHTQLTMAQQAAADAAAQAAADALVAAELSDHLTRVQDLREQLLNLRQEINQKRTAANQADQEIEAFSGTAAAYIPLAKAKSVADREFRAVLINALQFIEEALEFLHKSSNSLDKRR